VSEPATPTNPPAEQLQQLSEPDLGQLMAVFTQATARLSATHEALQGEVTRLRAELAEARGQVERSKHLALLGEMAAGIAHEVRNPLGSILLYARLLQEDLHEQPQPLALAGKIAQCVRRLECVVGDVLAFAREARPRVQAVDASEALEAAAEFARTEGPEWCGLEVMVDPRLERASLTVHADPVQLQQALINLVRNAAEIMHEQPRAGAPRRVELLAHQTSALDSDGRSVPMTALSVRDFGPGVPTEDAQRLFTPFFTTKAVGTGLGLAIVHRLLDAHGGRVSLRSWTDQHGAVCGAIAELLLPVPVLQLAVTPGIDPPGPSPAVPCVVVKDATTATSAAHF